MIQVVSAYLLIQRGELDDDNPAHVVPEYIPKEKFKYWLYTDPLRYGQHLYGDFSGMSTVYQLNSVHSATVWHSEYTQRAIVSMGMREGSTYTTLDGNESARELDYRTWGLIQTSSFSTMYIGARGVSSSEPIRNIQYYENESPTTFPFYEEVTYEVSGANPPEPPATETGNNSHGNLAAQYITQPGIYDDWVEKIFSSRMVNGIPVFTSYADGVDYVQKITAYRENQSSANYQAACDAIDKCINP